MEKLERYRTYIKKLSSDYASISPSDGEAETELVFDVERVGLCPAVGIAIKLFIQDGKIGELVKLGVPKSDIVLAFHEPLVRQYTGFAVG